MQLVKNAKGIALRSFSMWSMYLGFLSLNAPDIIYVTLERDTDPAMWSLIGNVLFIGGAIGRLVHQRSLPDD